MPVSLLARCRFKVLGAVSKLTMYQLSSTADNVAKLYVSCILLLLEALIF